MGILILLAIVVIGFFLLTLGWKLTFAFFGGMAVLAFVSFPTFLFIALILMRYCEFWFFFFVAIGYFRNKRQRAN